mgnify:CR=1 FL=1
MAAVELRQVHKSYDGVNRVIHGIDLEIRQGEFCVFVGPSGCGKSTLLRMIAGLEGITDGEVRIDGEVVNDKPPRLRDIAMVFQDYALYRTLKIAITNDRIQPIAELDHSRLKSLKGLLRNVRPTAQASCQPTVNSIPRIVKILGCLLLERSELVILNKIVYKILTSIFVRLVTCVPLKCLNQVELTARFRLLFPDRFWDDLWIIFCHTYTLYITKEQK